MITADQAVGLFNVVSGALFVALGLFVLSVRPREPANAALGVFAVAFGATWALVYVPRVVDLDGVAAQAALWAYPTTYAVAAAALLRLVGAFPAPAPGWGARTAALGIAYAGLDLALRLVPASASPTLVDLAGILGRSLGEGAFFAASIVLALRFPATRAGVARRSHTTVAAALMIYPAVLLGVSIGASGAQPSLVPPALVVLAILPVMALWLRNAAVVPDASRACRNLALLAPSVALANMLVAVAVSPAAAATWSAGLARFATVGVLVYGILQHQLLGIDVKVRWGISKTTLAAVFVAVFFVASEAAQEFFGETLGGSYVGILAAGLLVFAIAPLSRFADRVAERAVPIAARSAPGPGSVDPEAVYRDAVRLALRDRRLTAGDEMTLARLAEGLGIGAGRAMEIRQETKAEVPPR